jgi:hypothetical protein
VEELAREIAIESEDVKTDVGEVVAVDGDNSVVCEEVEGEDVVIDAEVGEEDVVLGEGGEVEESPLGSTVITTDVVDVLFWDSMENQQRSMAGTKNSYRRLGGSRLDLRDRGHSSHIGDSKRLREMFPT